MTNQEAPLGLSQLVSPEFQALVADFRVLFELAQTVGAVGKTDSFLEFCRRVESGEGPLETAGEEFGTRSVGDKAACLLEVATQSLLNCQRAHSGLASTEEGLALRTRVREQARESYFLASGYMMAIVHLRRQQSSQGAKGRRKIGARTRSQVIDAAKTYLGKSSKEAAAVKIAQSIGKSSGAVRKLLSEIFPGDKWSVVD